MARKPRTKERSARYNANYQKVLSHSGLVRYLVLVPSERIPELKAIALKWRRQADALLESDLPTADQILQIHGLCRTLRMKLPIGAFETRAHAVRWLIAQEPRIKGFPVYIPRRMKGG